MRSKKVEVCYVARVEGQGSIKVEVTPKGEVKRSEFAIFEPMRFFEAFLRGRKYSEVHELASRICGICPIAHQITALRAVENAYGIEISEQTRQLRRLLAFSAWIQSHSLSVFYLTAPDYMGHDGVISMASDHRELVEFALSMKKLGNDIGEVVGGRAIHPVSAVVGGFTSIPGREELQAFVPRLRKARKGMLEAAKVIGGFDYPVVDEDYELVAIHSDERYSVNEGRLVSNRGIDIPEEEYRKVVREMQVTHSNTKRSEIIGRGTFMVGPLARVALSRKQLSTGARKAVGLVGLDPNTTDPFANIRARVVEIVQSIDESLDIIGSLKLDVEQPVRAHIGMPCEGVALTEAPRGLLFHGYRFDRSGTVTSADIVPPTAHNSAHVEDAMRVLSSKVVGQGGDLSFECEKLVRAYDPCISCSVHAAVLGGN